MASSTLVDINGIDKCALLRALWERQMLDEDYRGRKVPDLTEEKIKAALTDDEGYVHMICGKFIKADLSEDVTDGAAFNAIAGDGAFEAVVKALRGPAAFESTFLSTFRRVEEYTEIRGDGTCYWRCLLIRMQGVIGGLPPLDFANGTSDEVFAVIDALRTDVAAFAEDMKRNHPDDWEDIKITTQQLFDESGFFMEAWLERLRKPVMQLQGRDRWADELVFALTPRMLARSGVDVDVRVKQWVVTNQQGRVLRVSNSPVVASAVVPVDLRYYTHENGDGYHYDLLPITSARDTNPVTSGGNQAAKSVVVDASDADSENGDRRGPAKRRRVNRLLHQLEDYTGPPHNFQPLMPSVDNRYTLRQRKSMIQENHRRTWPDGSYSIGRFSWGELNGPGTTYSAKGVKTEEGIYQDNFLHGPGKVYCQATGKLLFEGAWKRGCLVSGKQYCTGSGVLQYEGEFFGGDYVRLKRHGRGTIFYADGGKYFTGTFAHGDAHGEGEMYHPGGQIKLKGRFVKSCLSGKGEEFYESGRVKYRGDFRGGRYHGKGVEYDLDGRVVFEGEFHKGERV